jgi:acyl-CoA-binding protein
MMRAGRIPGNAMTDLKANFASAAEDVKQLDERPDNDTLLKLYALFKQGSDGDVTGPKPGFFDFVGTAKYEAWSKLKGMKADEAMQKYVDLVKKLRG